MTARDADRFAIGASPRRIEDDRLIRGQGRFTDDIHLAGEGHLYLLRSPHAHARILSIDTSEARAAPGVLAVLTGDDAAAVGIGGLPSATGRGRADGHAVPPLPHPVLAVGTVRYVGDPVVAIVAETAAQAMDAAELVGVDYEPLPAVADAQSARADGAPKVWAETRDNIAFSIREGDAAAVDQAFAAAEHVARLDFTVSRVTAATMEPRAAIGAYDAGADRYTLYTSVQGPHQLRSMLAASVLKVPEHKLRVIVNEVGGSFGMKSGIYLEYGLVLWAAKHVGRPVRWVATRNESFLSDDHGRDNVSRAELALDKDGTFRALRVTILVNIGAYPAARSAFPLVNIGGVAGVYTTPHICIEATGVFTNTNRTAPYRGSGRPEASYAIERVIDRAAAELGMDRVALRRRNLIPRSAMPFRTGLVFEYDCGEFEKNMDTALEAGDWAGFEARREAARAHGRLRGIGLANAIEVAGGPLATPREEHAEIRFAPDGSALVLIGTMACGQGHETAFTQILTERLGLAPDAVRIVQGDTDAVQYGRGSGSSRTIQTGGSVISLAADKIIDSGKRIAAHVLEAAEADITFADGQFAVVGTDRALSLADVARAAFNASDLPEGMSPGLMERAAFRPPAVTYPNGCHVCEVEIDPETGKVEVVAYHVVDDVGRVVNPALLEGQIQGGAAQGIGQALLEAIAYEPESSQLLSASFMDYAMPRADDIPPVHLFHNEVLTAMNPLGAKGAGEAGTVGALPAVMNAVTDALAPLGIRHLDMPATPQHVWAAIRDAKARGA